MSEPVKVGQVRETIGGPATVGALKLGGFGGDEPIRMMTFADGAPWAFHDARLAETLLLCPAPEDRRNGDLYRHAEGAEMMYLDHRVSEPWADRCLSRGWRIVERGPEKAAVATGKPLYVFDQTVPFDPEKSMRSGLYPDNALAFAHAISTSVGPKWTDFMAPIVPTRAASAVSRANPAPFLPGTWVCMADDAERDDRERDAYLVHSVDCVNGKWTVVAKYEAGEDARPISARYFIPAPPAVRNHAIRRWNRATIEAARETPPRAVTSFGQRKGEAWERYQRQLAGLLERASGAEPWLIGSGHIADLLPPMCDCAGCRGTA